MNTGYNIGIVERVYFQEDNLYFLNSGRVINRDNVVNILEYEKSYGDHEVVIVCLNGDVIRYELINFRGSDNLSAAFMKELTDWWEDKEVSDESKD
jgi:hypothetical protein